MGVFADFAGVREHGVVETHRLELLAFADLLLVSSWVAMLARFQFQKHAHWVSRRTFFLMWLSTVLRSLPVLLDSTLARQAIKVVRHFVKEKVSLLSFAKAYGSSRVVYVVVIKAFLLVVSTAVAINCILLSRARPMAKGWDQAGLLSLGLVMVCCVGLGATFAFAAGHRTLDELCQHGSYVLEVFALLPQLAIGLSATSYSMHAWALCHFAHAAIYLGDWLVRNAPQVAAAPGEVIAAIEQEKSDPDLLSAVVLQRWCQAFTLLFMLPLMGRLVFRYKWFFAVVGVAVASAVSHGDLPFFVGFVFAQVFVFLVAVLFGRLPLLLSVAAFSHILAYLDPSVRDFA